MFFIKQIVLTLPDDLTPLHKHKNTITQAARRLKVKDSLMPPVSSIPLDIPRTWFLKFKNGTNYYLCIYTTC